MALKVTRPTPGARKGYFRMLAVLVGAVLVVTTIASMTETRLRPYLGPIARASAAYLVGAAVGLYFLRFAGGGR